MWGSGLQLLCSPDDFQNIKKMSVLCCVILVEGAQRRIQGRRATVGVGKEKTACSKGGRICFRGDCGGARAVNRCVILPC